MKYSPKKPRVTSRGPAIPNRRVQLRAIQKAIAVGDVDDIAAAIAALTSHKLSVSRIRRQLATLTDVQRDAALRRFCRAVGEHIADLAEVAEEMLRCEKARASHPSRASEKSRPKRLKND